MKKIVSLLLIMLCMGLAAGACAATYTGETEDCTWTFDDVSGILTISGNGEMVVNYFGKTTPWNEYKDQIKKVVIEEGVANVGGYSFNGCSELTDVEIASSVALIGNSAFDNCTKLKTMKYWGSAEPQNNAANVTYLFENCSSLEYVQVPTDYTGDDFFWMSVRKTLPALYTVTVNDGVAEKNKYKAGDTVEITANAPKDGMQFSGWTSSDGVTFADASAASTTFTMPAGNVTVTATYKSMVVPVISITHGNIGTQYVTEGKIIESVFLKASVTPEVELEFAWYQCDDRNKTNARKIEGETKADFGIPKDLTAGNYYYYCVISAEGAQSVTSGVTQVTVKKPSYAITISANPQEGGSVTGAVTYEKETEATVTAATHAGYTFDGWYEDGACVSIDMSYTFTVSDARTLEARWSKSQYTILFNTDGGSAIAPITQSYGSEVGAPEDPTKDGYAFIGWVDEDGKLVTFPLAMQQEGMRLTAVWEMIPVPVLPQTGDNSALGLWTLLTGLAGAALLMLRRREN